MADQHTVRLIQEHTELSEEEIQAMESEALLDAEFDRLEIAAPDSEFKGLVKGLLKGKQATDASLQDMKDFVAEIGDD